MTVSLVARDSDTGDLGIASASFVLAVGAGVPYLRSGVGAIAVQGGAPPGWGELALRSLEAGASAQATCDELAGLSRSGAQIVVLDSQGRAAVLCDVDLEPEVSTAVGEGIGVAANLMERPEVAQAALGAYRSSKADDLAGRLLDGLSAADGMGGDVRGRQSAAVRVVAGGGASSSRSLVDLRVDDSRDPVGELRRLYRLHRAHQLLIASRGPDGLYRDIAAAEQAVRLAPDDQGCLSGLALALLRAGRPEEARPLLVRLRELEARTPERFRRLVRTGHLAIEISSLSELFGDGPGEASLGSPNNPNDPG